MSARGLSCGDALVLSAQGAAWWIAVLQSVCGEALVLSVRGLCCGDSFVLPVQVVVKLLAVLQFFVVNLSCCLCEACVVVMLWCYLHKDSRVCGEALELSAQGHGEVSNKF